MGKRGGGGKGKGGRGGGYTHVVTHNPNKHESGERRMQMLRNLEIKRLDTRVNKQKDHMRSYFPPDVVAKKKQKVDPHYDLKGPARPAREFYLGKEEEFEPVDLLDQYDGKLWEHEEGQILLRALLEYGTALHNVGNRTKDAIATFQSMQKQDPGDHLLARHRLLGCYLDLAEADKARALLDEFPDDVSAYFSYSRALIEYLSLQLGEEGASVAVRDAQLLTANSTNPYALFALAHHQVFSQVLEHTSVIQDSMSAPGSVEDAIRYFSVNLDLWQEIDGALEWAKSIAKDLPPPLCEIAEQDEDADEESDGAEADAEGDSDGDSDGEGDGEGEMAGPSGGGDDAEFTLEHMSEAELHTMFSDMFNTAVEMALEE